MSRERELLKILRTWNAFDSWQAGGYWKKRIDAILSQPEAEQTPADAPTPDKCPACSGTLRNCIVAIQNGVTCNHWWHKEPAPQQTPCYSELDKTNLPMPNKAAATPADSMRTGEDTGVPNHRVPAQSAADRGPTPETDDFIRYWISVYEDPTSGNHFRGHHALLKIAKQLKTERDAARAELARLTKEK